MAELSSDSGVTRRTLMTGMAAAAAAAGTGVVLGAGRAGAASATAAAAAPGAPRAVTLAQVGPLPGTTSARLAYRHVPGSAFHAPSSTVPWSVSATALTTTDTGVFTTPLLPGVGDLLRELDVVIDPGGQGGVVTLTRYDPFTDASEVLATATYPAVTGRQTVVLQLDHRADPQSWTYLVSVELRPGVVLHAANLWYFPLEAGFVQLTPQRAYDSRDGDGKLLSGEVRTISLANVLTQVPGSALVNLTIDQTEGSGHLTAWTPVGEDGSPPPNTSNLNWTTDGQTVANLAVVKLGGEHFDAFAVRAGGPGRTHLIVDVVGYFA